MDLWSCPAIDIQPDDFILIFCSGKDRAIPTQELHTNFKIKENGEALFLTKFGTIIHSLPEANLKKNMSFGCITDGFTPVVTFNISTPGFSNNNSEPNLEKLSFNKLGGHYDETFDLSITFDADSDIYYTTDGTTPTINSKKYDAPLALDLSFYSNVNISQLKNSTDELHIPPPIDKVLKSIVIRAVAINHQGKVVSKTTTNSY